jgi:hypothetical protein
LRLQPGNAILLVDTYGDIHGGIERAIQASINTKVPLMGVRIDSGDLYELTWYARNRIDQAKQDHPDLFSKTGIVLTDGINEAKLIEWNSKSLKEKQAPFPVTHVGIGTNFVAIAAKGNVYKASAIGEQPIAKIGEKLLGSKTSLPGSLLDTLRLYKDGKLVAEVIVDKAEFDLDGFKKSKDAVSYNNELLEKVPEFDEAEFLLVTVFAANAPIITEIDAYCAKWMKTINSIFQRVLSKKVFHYVPGQTRFVYTKPSLAEMRMYAEKEKNKLPDHVKRAENPAKIPQYVSYEIYKRLEKMKGEIKVA